MNHKIVNQSSQKIEFPLQWYVSRVCCDGNAAKVCGSMPNIRRTSDFCPTMSWLTLDPPTTGRLTSITYVNSACRIERYETAEDSGIVKIHGGHTVVFDDLNIATKVKVGPRGTVKFAGIETKILDDDSDTLSNVAVKGSSVLANEPRNPEKKDVYLRAKLLHSSSKAKATERPVFTYKANKRGDTDAPFKALLSDTPSKVKFIGSKHRIQEDRTMSPETLLPDTLIKVQVKGLSASTQNRPNRYQIDVPFKGSVSSNAEDSEIVKFDGSQSTDDDSNTPSKNEFGGRFALFCASNHRVADESSETSLSDTYSESEVEKKSACPYKSKHQAAYTSSEESFSSKRTRKSHFDHTTDRTRKDEECTWSAKRWRLSGEKYERSQATSSSTDSSTSDTDTSSAPESVGNPVSSYKRKFDEEDDLPLSYKRQAQCSQAACCKQEKEQTKGKADKREYERNQTVVSGKSKRCDCGAPKCPMWHIAPRRTNCKLPRARIVRRPVVFYDPQIEGKLISITHVNPACRIERYEIPEFGEPEEKFSCANRTKVGKKSCVTLEASLLAGRQISIDYAPRKYREGQALSQNPLVRNRTSNTRNKTPM